VFVFAQVCWPDFGVRFLFIPFVYYSCFRIAFEGGEGDLVGNRIFLKYQTIGFPVKFRVGEIGVWARNSGQNAIVFYRNICQESQY
jgi:hypothetical protein